MGLRHFFFFLKTKDLEKRSNREKAYSVEWFDFGEASRSFRVSRLTAQRVVLRGIGLISGRVQASFDIRATSMENYTPSDDSRPPVLRNHSRMGSVELTCSDEF